MKTYCRIAVNFPLKNSLLTYIQDNAELSVGMLVKVPLGKRSEKGCIIEVNLKEDQLSLAEKNYEHKLVKEILTHEIRLSLPEIELFQWMSGYYHYSLGKLIFDCLPKLLKRPRKLTPHPGNLKPFDFKLTLQQQETYDSLKHQQGFQQNLIHGITGSGKSIIYLKLMLDQLALGKSVLFLLPEINLTPQFTEIFMNYLTAPLYIYHSELSGSDRFQLWKLLQKDDSPKLILGVRSSIFLPIKNLGLIVIDEEHDGSFKQDDRCSYHARDVALKKASLLKIPVVMGSATPAVETFARFYQKKNYFVLDKRVGKAQLPAIELVDIRDTQETKDSWPIARSSLDEIQASLVRKEQILVFVNRLGFARSVQCRACGFTFDCPNCSLSLRYFKERDRLACQYCEYFQSFPEQCPECDNLKLLQRGFGTEKIVEVLQKSFPEARIARFDRDDIRNLTQLKERLKEFHEHQIDIMVGTQMLSKGHNFQRVNLVLILGIDSQLNYADFRSQEKVFQQATQVAGRSGRFGEKSKVLIQTLNPENEVFEYIQGKKNSLEFYKNELSLREMCACPPYTRLAQLFFSSRFKNRLIEQSQQATDLLQDIAKKHFPEVRVLGPRPSAIEKKVNKYTWCILLKSLKIQDLHGLLATFEHHFKAASGISCKIEIDPYTQL